MTNLPAATTNTNGTSHKLVRNAGAGLTLVAAMFLGACSTEALLEETIERTTDLEDVNLGEDGGGFTITDENGEKVTFDFDDTGAGSVIAEDADGNETVSLDFDEEGGSLVFTDDGEESRVDVTIDEENEQVVIEDSYGNDLVIAENDTGGVVLEGSTADGSTATLDVDDDGASFESSDADGSDGLNFDVDNSGATVGVTEDGDTDTYDIDAGIDDEAGEGWLNVTDDEGNNVFDFELDEDSLSGSSTDGGFWVGAQDIPDWLPASFPLPTGGEVMASSTGTGGSAVSVAVEGDVASVSSAHRDALQAQGYDVSSEPNSATGAYSATHADGTTVLTTVTDTGTGLVAVTMIFS